MDKEVYLRIVNCLMLLSIDSSLHLRHVRENYEAANCLYERRQCSYLRLCHITPVTCLCRHDRSTFGRESGGPTIALVAVNVDRHSPVVEFQISAAWSSDAVTSRAPSAKKAVE